MAACYVKLLAKPGMLRPIMLACLTVTTAGWNKVLLSSNPKSSRLLAHLFKGPEIGQQRWRRL